MMHSTTNFAPVAFIIIALAMMVWADVVRISTTKQVNEWRNQADPRTNTRLLEQLSYRIEELGKRIAEAEREDGSSVAWVDPRPRTLKPEPPLDPLKAEKSKIQNGLLPVLDGLKQWSSAGYIDFYGIAPAAGRLDEINRQVADAKQRLQLKALEAEIERILPDLLCVAITKSDLSLDPDRTNGLLQDALKYAVESAGLSMIDPKPGSVLDRVAHRKINLKRGPSGQQGKVAEVRYRGLQDKSGNVIQPAEVSEFF